MKIKPYIDDPDDGYDDNTVRYYESVTPDGYFYELYVLIDNKYSAIIITENGVSVDFREGSKSGYSIHTNIVPVKLFPNRKSLKWKYLLEIIEILEATGMEGKSYSKKEMDTLFNKWKSQHGG